MIELNPILSKKQLGLSRGDLLRLRWQISGNEHGPINNTLPDLMLDKDNKRGRFTFRTPEDLKNWQNNITVTEYNDGTIEIDFAFARQRSGRLKSISEQLKSSLGSLRRVVSQVL